MAETALDVISRCRVTSVSSSVAGFAGGGSSAARGGDDVSYSGKVAGECAFGSRETTPGGNPAAAVGGGPPGLGETVARSSFSSTSTHPERTGSTALWNGRRGGQARTIEPAPGREGHARRSARPASGA